MVCDCEMIGGSSLVELILFCVVSPMPLILEDEFNCLKAFRVVPVAVGTRFLDRSGNKSKNKSFISFATWSNLIMAMLAALIFCEEAMLSGTAKMALLC